MEDQELKTSPRRSKDFRTAQIFTTGQVATVCGVSPRTAAKWIDDKKIEGYRIPGSADRRVSRQALIDFIKAHNMPETMLAKIGAA